MAKRPPQTKMFWEWNWPRVWGLEYGIHIFDCTFEINWAGDHSPAFHLTLILFNIVLIDCGYYNVYHEDYTNES